MNKRFLKLTAAVLTVAAFMSLVLCGCSGGTTQQSGESGALPDATPQAHTLKLPYSKTDKLNPFTARSMLNQSVAGLVYDGLFSLDKNYAPVARIAQSHSQSGRTLTVTLGSAKFSDGSQVSASDVVASFNSAKSSPAYQSRLSGFASARASGSNVLFTLSRDDPYAVNCLDFAVTKGGSTAENAVGCGRYVLVSNDGGYSLKASDSRSGFSPEIKEISLYNMQDATALKYTLAIGNISFAFDDLRAGEYTRFSASTVNVLMNNLVFLGFNRSNQALSSAEIRRAVSLLIDRGQIAQNAFQGHASAALTPFNPDWSAISGKDYTAGADLEAARGLLDGAGYTTSSGSVRSNGSRQLSFRLLVNRDNAFKLEAAEYIKDMLAAANIRVDIEQLGEQDYISAVSSGSYDMYIGEIKLTSNMDLSPLLLPGGAVTYGINTAGAASTAYSSMLSGASDVHSFIDAFNSDPPFLPLCYRSGIAAYTRSIQFDGDVHINDVYSDIASWKFIS